MKQGFLLTVLLVLVMACSVGVQAYDDVGLDHVATTFKDPSNAVAPWQVAEMVCCHCYSTLSDGRRFYHGILEAGFCRSQRRYCEGYAKCF